MAVDTDMHTEIKIKQMKINTKIHLTIASKTVDNDTKSQEPESLNFKPLKKPQNDRKKFIRIKEPKIFLRKNMNEKKFSKCYQASFTEKVHTRSLLSLLPILNREREQHKKDGKRVSERMRAGIHLHLLKKGNLWCSRACL